MSLMERFVRRGARWGIPNLGSYVLGRERERALEETLEWATPRVSELVEGLSRGEADARQELHDTAEAALQEMRARTRNHAAEAGVLSRVFAHIDAWWSDTDDEEYIDDPGLEPRLRQRAMNHLDLVNELIGSYRAFLEFLRPAMDEIEGRPLRIIDLAAGHGGFALAVARHARIHGRAVEITATDIKREYLDMGAAIAHEQGLAVRFAVQDALDLSNLEPGHYDVVVCTQSLHHFPAGAVAVMIQEAVRAAGHSVVFADGMRTLMLAIPLYGFLRASLRDPILAHDAWVSCRRFFAPEELLLLARLGPWGERAVVMRPATHMNALVVPARDH